MLRVKMKGDSLRFGSQLDISFLRTLRIPDDGRTYPLPPGLGHFPLRAVRAHAATVPQSWRERGGVFLPMYQREAMWISFSSPSWLPCAVKVGVGKVNAISGEPWDERIEPGRQDYLVTPPQPWLDGIKAGEGFIRQFVAMPLGMGYTVEGQVTGKEEFGGLQIVVFAPKPGLIEKPTDRCGTGSVLYSPDCMVCECSRAFEMGLGAGGRMRQQIYPDPHGADTWDQTNTGRVFVSIANSMAWREITGQEAPATPISARTYSQHGLPWFDLYDEGMGDLPAAAALKGVKSIKEMDQQKGFAPQQDDGSITLEAEQLKLIGAPDGVDVSGGQW